MLNSFIDWLMQIADSFDGSDFLSLFIGIGVVVVCRNLGTIMWNRNHPHRRLALPKLNMRLVIASVIILVFFGVFWSQLTLAASMKRNAAETHAIAVRTCEDSKVSSIERNGVQTLLLTSLNDPRSKLPPEDPVREEWRRSLGLEYLGILDKAGQLRRSIRDGGHVSSEDWKKYMGEQVEPKCF